MEDNQSSSSSSSSSENQDSDQCSLKTKQIDNNDGKVDQEKQRSANINNNYPNKSTNNSNSALDIDLVCDCFQRSIEDRNEIDLLLYLQGYSELIKFFNIFGTLFTFVTKDVHSKIALLQTYFNDEKDGSNYRSIQSMVEFEIDRNLLKDQKRPSGSRTLLRLHRALEFISVFLHQVTKLDDDVSTTVAARDAYNQTLAKYHQWWIRKSVQLATMALPYRKTLVEKIYGGQCPSGGQSVVNENLNYLANIADQVFNSTQKLYQDNDLLDLP